MKSTLHLVTTLSALLMCAGAAAAQAPAEDETSGAASTKPALTDMEKDEQEKEAAKKKGRTITMQHYRAYDQRGLNVFETPKLPGAEFTGFKLDFNAAFTSQVQSLSHENTALPNVVNGVNSNELADIGFGFNNSTANVQLHAQLAEGVRVQLTSYLSSRHHNETWVKDGFILIDKLPVDVGPINALMDFVTLRVGHMEINYGDAHFRRTDNGHALYNPFVGNYILDAFTTEIGGEGYLRLGPLMAMAGITGGEIRGTVLTPEKRGPAFLGKLGYDNEVRPHLRVRLTGSMYKTDKAVSSTLYGGDRAGSRYYYVLENTAATESAQFTSGAINPGFRNEVTALQVNPFVKCHGLEFFGVIERAKGRASTEAADREFNQYAADVVYRFAPREQFFAGVRYNKAEGQLAGIPTDVGADRWQIGGGWFVTPNVLMKAEYVSQEFKGYPTTNIRNGGKFKGLMLEGVVAF
jgi:hypothetical protein